MTSALRWLRQIILLAIPADQSRSQGSTVRRTSRVRVLPRSANHRRSGVRSYPRLPRAAACSRRGLRRCPGSRDVDPASTTSPKNRPQSGCAALAIFPSSGRMNQGRTLQHIQEPPRLPWRPTSARGCMGTKDNTTWENTAIQLVFRGNAVFATSLEAKWSSSATSCTAVLFCAASCRTEYNTIGDMIEMVRECYLSIIAVPSMTTSGMRGVTAASSPYFDTEAVPPQSSMTRSRW
ncbi:hypothetical protein C8Q77DRAFT_689058 [Trametes polyzona]|nr:hypothetical protein C8Q77DRAFT_689058 [Trametes polyzona]